MTPDIRETRPLTPTPALPKGGGLVCLGRIRLIGLIGLNKPDKPNVPDEPDRI